MSLKVIEISRGSTDFRKNKELLGEKISCPECDWSEYYNYHNLGFTVALGPRPDYFLIECENCGCAFTVAKC